jgi:AraC-like DNA-binding protein
MAMPAAARLVSYSEKESGKLVFGCLWALNFGRSSKSRCAMRDKSDFISLVPEGSPHRVVGERVVILPGIDLNILTTRVIELETWILCGLNDPFWRLYVPISGEAVVWAGEEEEETAMRLRPGEAYLIAPHTTLNSRNPEAFKKWYVHFTLGPAGDRAMPGIYPVVMTARMRAALEELGELGENGGEVFPWASAGLVAKALQQLPAKVWSERQLDARVERAMDFMHANLNRKLTTGDVARAAGLSVRNLNHLYSQHVERSPMRVLLDFRLDEACRLLRYRDDSIEQIAEDCGFPNRYYFSRMLKRHRGVSPAAYRDAAF